MITALANPIANTFRRRSGSIHPVPNGPQGELFYSGRKRKIDLRGLPESLWQQGSLELKLAVTRREIRQAQKLRWRVFYELGDAQPDRLNQLKQRDVCAFDKISDHLIVVDHAAVSKRGKVKPRVVGTYRLMRQDVAEACTGFYSANEFDADALVARHHDKTFLELGRSCILPEYRSKRVLELLWRGIWLYSVHHSIDVMIGCASLPGIDPARFAPVLTHIRDNALADGKWCVPSLPGRNKDIADYCSASVLERSDAEIPPLIKGYLRLGARFGEGIFIDRQFNSSDVFVILPTADINPRYVAYFSGAAN